MPYIKHIETKRISARTYYGRFCVLPLPAGQGITLGNALRRILLGDLVGFAATSANLAGASHEFDTLPGIRESVLEILLNIKQLVFKQISSRPKDTNRFAMRASLNLTGPATVTAKDLVLPSWMKVVDPSQYIATLASGASLEFEIQLSQGSGYRLRRTSLVPPGFTLPPPRDPLEPENDSKSETKSKSKGKSKNTSTSDVQLADTDVNAQIIDTDSNSTETEKEAPHIPSMRDDHMTLHIDAVFFPVTRVNYRVEEEVINGRRREELVIDIWTNGSLSPRKALDQAAVILIRMLASLQAPPPLLIEPEKKPTTKTIAKEIALTPIESLDLSVRSFNCLKRANITNVGKLIAYTRQELLQLKNFGTKSASEVVDVLNSRFKLALKGEEVTDQEQVVNQPSSQIATKKGARKKVNRASRPIDSKETRRSRNPVKSTASEVPEKMLRKSSKTKVKAPKSETLPKPSKSANLQQAEESLQVPKLRRKSELSSSQNPEET
uniref:DNA-directed RNA polymerase subunit alpha n=1 Tax=Nephroselmis olivacea TaxID=31312 RepID=RPOA_NEPOL|nr:RNA polymerase alpha chain [Nephroselmis olivacea]Q9TL28.1 RecName: Full=DNA-directed RNA polymerase subunit alpha; Short=PEP; AltName: Full=Plastid-encoded RNA polymerase subunit alpha; Short=RNA polymerase subunit alpha [Nephroselmis olivacea]AAD54788.1 alpha subunit of RNA polymerase [Nephroselmis olivacea]